MYLLKIQKNVRCLAFRTITGRVERLVVTLILWFTLFKSKDSTPTVFCQFWILFSDAESRSIRNRASLSGYFAWVVLARLKHLSDIYFHVAWYWNRRWKFVLAIWKTVSKEGCALTLWSDRRYWSHLKAFVYKASAYWLGVVLDGCLYFYICSSVTAMMSSAVYVSRRWYRRDD